MSSVLEYFKGLFQGIGGLLTGMSVTWKELFSKKITQQYPENRGTLVISERFRGELVMPHDSNNEHACTSCGICEMNCPNGTIKITSKSIETEDGKKKKALVTYHYNLGMCTFCNLCVLTCPSDAIKFENVFESANFTRESLHMILNKDGSKLREKKKNTPKPETPKPVVEETGVNGSAIENRGSEKTANNSENNKPESVSEPVPTSKEESTNKQVETTSTDTRKSKIEAIPLRRTETTSEKLQTEEKTSTPRRLVRIEMDSLDKKDESPTIEKANEPEKKGRYI
ncbi:MAG: hypothetical protein RL662_2453 [Bacteroidota bacterium]|jgi:NADH-quinone oxidoreductase subunit I